MSSLSRRQFLRTATAVAAAGCVRGLPAAAAPSAEFNFLFLTDTHLQPELNATEGCRMAFRRARTFHTDFAVQGGDHIFDALGVPLTRSEALFRQYAETEQQLGMRVVHTIGNHDVVGIYPQSGVAATDPAYGKKFFQDHIGPLYQSFEHKGVRFLVLDSIGLTSDHAYEGRVDAAQLEWLKGELAKAGASQPVIVISHIPLVTAFDSYVALLPTPPAHHGQSVANAHEVIETFAGHNVLGVLQGHTHINERVEFNGVPYITSGAVCGNWWKGVRMGTPEGFTVCSVSGGRLTTRYETYGFKAVAS